MAGLIDSTLALLREPDVTHIGAATDYVIESWRNDLYPGYKSSAGIDPELMRQFRDAERALEALGVVVWPMIEDEADDGIATAVARHIDDCVACETERRRMVNPTALLGAAPAFRPADRSL